MFHEILDTLDEIACSSFVNTPEGSFHTMQEDWKVEIQVMFDELRSKEKVGVHRIITERHTAARPATSDTHLHSES